MNRFISGWLLGIGTVIVAQYITETIKLSYETWQLMDQLNHYMASLHANLRAATGREERE